MSKEKVPQIGVIMGSPSDLSTMRHAGRALRMLGLELNQDYKDEVVSAHRSPKWMTEYAETAKERGLKVIIAGAGGSAHLPGMVASETTLPVLGVAVTKSPDVLNRALGSMIGMPEGKPLATFQAEAGAFNAGLFAARILALNRPILHAAIEAYDISLADGVYRHNDNLVAEGAEEFLRREAEEARHLADSDSYYDGPVQ